jgi:hypothetical protein
MTIQIVPFLTNMLLLLLLLVPLLVTANNDFIDLPPWSDSPFGEWELEGSLYRMNGVGDIRHNGWSWNHIRTTPSFCATSYLPVNASQAEEEHPRVYEMSGCQTPNEQCEKMGGSVFGYNCMEDPKKPFTVLGPDCWNKKCSIGDLATSRQICESTLGGAFVSPQAFGSSGHPYATEGIWVSGSYCFVPGRHTVLGPACYGNTCFKEELASVCSSLGGTVYADIYCLLDAKYTVVGPICRPSRQNVSDAVAEQCLTEETIEFCTDMGGSSVGDVFCVLEGEYSALGPFCWAFAYLKNENDSNNITATDSNNTTPECLTEEGLEACNSLGGTPIGDGLFCVLKGNDYHYWGEYWGGGGIGIGSLSGDFFNSSVCESDFGGTNLGSCGCILKGDYTVGVPMNWGETQIHPEQAEWDLLGYDGSGFSFVLDGTYTVYGPNCYGEMCFPAPTQCEKGGGVSIAGGLICAVSSSKSTSFSFTTEEGLPAGIILILSLLSFIVVVQSVVLFIWWRKRGTCKEKESIEKPEAHVDSPSDPDPSD